MARSGTKLLQFRHRHISDPTFVIMAALPLISDLDQPPKCPITGCSEPCGTRTIGKPQSPYISNPLNLDLQYAYMALIPSEPIRSRSQDKIGVQIEIAD